MKPTNESYKNLQIRLELLKGITCGEEAIQKGRSFTQKQAKQKLKKWLKSSTEPASSSTSPSSVH